MKRQDSNFLTTLILVVVATTVPATSFAQQSQFSFTPVLLNGDAPTGQNGTTGTIGSGSANFVNQRLSDAGAFSIVGLVGGNITNTTDAAIAFTPGGLGNAQILVQQGQAVPGTGGGIFNFLGDPISNNPGDVAFVAVPSNSLDNGFFFFDSASPGLTEIARESGAVPGGDLGATFDLISFADDPFINDNGQVLYTARTTGGTVGDAEGVFLFDRATNTSTTILRGGPTPSGGTFDRVLDDSLTLNGSGSGAFVVEIEGAATTDEALVTFNNNGAITIAAQQGDAAPGGGFYGGGFGATFDDDEISLNDSNQIVFQADLATSTGASIGNGLFFDTDITTANGVQAFLRTGDTISLSGQTFAVDNINSDRSFQLNEAGQFAFGANLDTGSAADDDVLLIGDVNNPGSFTVLAREGDAIDSTNTAFFDSIFDDDLNINEAGQVLFAATSLDDASGGSIGTSQDSAIFFFDPTLGLLTVAQEGDSFLDGQFGQFGSLGAIEEQALRDDGSFIFEFVSGSDNGVILGTLTPTAVPEPSSALLFSLASLGALMSRRRK